MRRVVGPIPVLILLLCTLAPLRAAEWEWRTFTNASDVRQVLAADTLVWAATNGGVLSYSPVTGRFTPFVNTDGLAGNEVAAVERDRHGRIWMAASGGLINVYTPSSGRWQTISDYDGQSIKDLTVLGDSLFVSLDIGISLFDAGRWEVKETYKIGRVNRTLIDGRQIWAACPDGVRASNLDLPNLMAPAAWTLYTIADGLPHSEALSLAAHEGRIYTGTLKGLGIFDGTSWLPGELLDNTIADLAVWGEQLAVSAGYAVLRRNGANSYSQIGNGLAQVTSLSVDGSGRLWAGISQNGLAWIGPEGAAWNRLLPDGPADNKYTALTFDRNGVLWTASSSGGISRYDGSSWRVFNRKNGLLPGNDYRTLAVDNRNRVWAGSWGTGIALFTTSGDSIAIDILDAQDGLAGISVNPNYVVITGLHADKNGNMWILNYQADNLQILAVVDSLGNWQYFTTRDGIKSKLTTAIASDQNNRVWIGTQDRGISVLDHNDTPFNKSDDDLSQGLSTEDGLNSLAIRTLACDADGVMWIGTPEGLEYWYEGALNPRYQVINDDINVVSVDVRNNKWIGTSGGMSMFEADGYTWRHFSTSTSALVGDNVTSFAFNEHTGQLYIGTTNGLSRLQTPFTRPAANLSRLAGYPNPFTLEGPGALFYIENLADKATVRIYTPEGRLIRHIPAVQIHGSRTIWDGRNDRGELVASGIYLFLATTESGEAGSGKVAVIRP
ncbi:MAG TPA: two-component regulator propeller domain-containing protein [bacterium]|nr:two-component regulator propeller domain-containing protein [bacterium]HOY44285.1 two-component regulator propeller domain-containing protein [bacterium]HPG83937.1 two-component regulator propeller domain-containing protein [bacterium]HPM59431.1 two-component regulator propeller domain-containing protein [bacterium]